MSEDDCGILESAAPTTSPKNSNDPVSDVSNTRKLHLAIAGCSHGEMDIIYSTLAEIEKQQGYKFDLLICCGDYQSIRNYGDLEQMHVNNKYKDLKTFYKYYNGEKIAPILTIFVGGNHEASGYLCELPNGGWVAPRIYYMGFSNVIRFAGLRIGGLSGIFKPFDFHKGHFERPPFNKDTMISAYHVRNLDVWRLRQLRPADDKDTVNSLDIMITHDWPNEITDFGNVKKLLRFKPHFTEDIEKKRLGNPSTMTLLWETRPRYWFSAHLHCMFAALVPHKKNDNGQSAQPTKFLALNKPIPGRHFVHALNIDISDDANTVDLFYDPEWLAVLKNTDNFTSTSNQVFATPTTEELAEIEFLGDLKIPEDFKRTAEPCTGDYVANPMPSVYYRNPQTTRFCRWLGIQDLNKMLADLDSSTLGLPYYMHEATDVNPNEIQLNDEELFGEDDFIIDTNPISDPNTRTLDNFEAPTWKGGNPATEPSAVPMLKRRKVDFNEEE